MIVRYLLNLEVKMKLAKLKVKTLKQLAKQFDNLVLGLTGELYIDDAGMSAIHRDLLGKTVLGHPTSDGSQYILLCFVEGEKARNTVNAIIYKDYVEVVSECEI